MLLAEYNNIERGNAARLAATLGITLSYLSQLASGHRRVSPALAVRIEQLTGGSVTRAELRPDDYWLIWPDLVQLPDTKNFYPNNGTTQVKRFEAR